MAIRKNCIVCEKEIHRSKYKKGLALRRGNKAVTCSRPCARIYTRIVNYIRGRINRENKKKKKKK